MLQETITAKTLQDFQDELETFITSITGGTIHGIITHPSLGATFAATIIYTPPS